MAEYLIQDRTMTELANQTRRITGETDSMNAAEILESLSKVQVETAEPKINYYVEAVDYDFNTIKSGNYEDGTIFALPNPEETQTIPENLVFEKWIAPTSTVGNFINVEHPVTAAPLCTTKSGCVEVGIYSSSESEFTVDIWTGNRPRTIDWGDGTIEDWDAPSGSHTYSTGGYYRVIFMNPTYDYISVLPFSGSGNIPTEYKITDMHFPCNIHTNDFTLRFKYLPDLSTCTFGSGVAFDEMSFQDCANLSRIVVPEGATSITHSMFYGATSLTEVVLPNTITSIGNYAFSESGITSLIIPTSVTSALSHICYGCKNLTKVVICGCVEEIDDYSFRYCDNLKDVIITCKNGVIPLQHQTAFNRLNESGLDTLPTNFNIYVPDELIDDYAIASSWSVLYNKNYIKPLSEYTESE